jgi:hypothetical protein
MERISFTAAIPLFAINTLVMTVCPPFWATKSFTRPGAALSTEFPPAQTLSVLFAARIRGDKKLPRKLGVSFGREIETMLRIE